MQTTTEQATRPSGRQHRLLMIDAQGPDGPLTPHENGGPPGLSPVLSPLLPWLESLGGELAAISRRMGHPPLGPELLSSLPGTVRRALEGLEESVVNAHTATRQAISLLAPPAEAHETLNPDQLWMVLRSTLQFSGRRNLRLQWEHEPAGGWLRVSPTGLLKALQELLRNAVEAMPDGGILCIRQAERVLTAAELAAVRRGQADALEGSATARPGRPGRAFLCLQVCDTGYGIPAELMERVLAGGYSTHAGRDGRGLERARAVIQAHHGHLLLDSRVGAGTTVSVLLPLLDRAPVELPPVRHARVQSGKGRILLAEDDTGIRETTAEILERLGYTVECARDGEDALRRLEGAARPFDLVILDLMMPVLGGIETLKRLRERDSTLPVLMVTGFMMDEDVDNIARIWGVPVIQKPFKLADFSRQVALRLGGSHQADTVA
jgi:two-component system cell cycle sensor histidine kinase/response regulator CckA